MAALDATAMTNETRNLAGAEGPGVAQAMMDRPTLRSRAASSTTHLSPGWPRLLVPRGRRQRHDAYLGRARRRCECRGRRVKRAPAHPGAAARSTAAARERDVSRRVVRLLLRRRVRGSGAHPDPVAARADAAPAVHDRLRRTTPRRAHHPPRYSRPGNWCPRSPISRASRSTSLAFPMQPRRRRPSQNSPRSPSRISPCCSTRRAPAVHRAA